LEEWLQRKLRQAAAAVGVGQVLPGFADRELNFTETRDEIDRLRREDASLFEEAGPSALYGEEYWRTLERELAPSRCPGSRHRHCLGSRDRIPPVSGHKESVGAQRGPGLSYATVRMPDDGIVRDHTSGSRRRVPAFAGSPT
jgi:hypothetical protein